MIQKMCILYKHKCNAGFNTESNYVIVMSSILCIYLCLTQDDEYVIYSPTQQRLKYLVEFTTDTDIVKDIEEQIQDIYEFPLSDEEEGNEISMFCLL